MEPAPWLLRRRPPAVTPPGLTAYTLADVERALGVRYTAEQSADLRIVPFDRITLAQAAGTHVLFPGFPLSLCDLRSRHPELFLSRGECWYEGWPFAITAVPPRWYLLRRAEVPQSCDKPWQEQQLLMGRGAVPRTNVVAFGAVLHALVTGERLFHARYVRTADGTGGDCRVYAGMFTARGLGVNTAWEGYRDETIGVAWMCQTRS